LATFYSIGHSNRGSEEFLALLRQAGVTHVVDVRTIPKSRHNPQFNADTLAQFLRSHSIAYTRIPGLGGLRGPQKDQSASPNGFWENESFRNYADYTATPPFKAALEELRELGRSQTCAMMCAEAVWWRCHRRIIVDYLVASAEMVIHIMGAGKLDPAHLTEAAVIQPDRTIVYPGAQGALPL
jgi:uncharacterized protein (DUF488 family)